MWPSNAELPGFREAVHGYAEACSSSAAPAVMALVEESLALPRGFCPLSTGNALSYLTTRVYPPAAAAAEEEQKEEKEQKKKKKEEEQKEEEEEDEEEEEEEDGAADGVGWGMRMQ